MWRECLPAGDLPHVHDDINVNYNTTLFDINCFMKVHMNAFGTSYLPRYSTSTPGFLPTCHKYPGHLQSFGNQHQYTRNIVSTKGCMDPFKFLQDHVKKNIPVIMKKCGDMLPAKHKWRYDDYFFKVASNWEDPHLGRFRDWLRVYKIENDYRARRIFDSMAPPFVKNLENDIKVPSSFARSIEANKLHRNFQVIFWMNSGNKRSRLHFDSHDALLTQLFGTKEIYLVSPEESHKLYAGFPWMKMLT